MNTDKDIIQAIKFGNKEKAIALIYKKYFPKIKKMILNRGGAIDDAKDVFQEAVITFYVNNLNGKINENDVNIDAYITLVAKTKFIDKLRKDNKIDFKDDIQENTQYDHLLLNNQILNEYSTEKENVIEKMLTSVGERCYELLQLAIFQKFNMKQIAEKLGFSNEDSAKSQHYKCKAKLIQLYRENSYVKSLLMD